MSSELERQLREAREALPLPDPESTQRSRGRAVASLHRRRRRSRALVLAAATLVSAVGIGVTAGSLNAPGVTAAREPAELGFVPEPGWFALQSPPPAIEGQQTAAVAANVPFAADDVRNGLVEPSGLPYSTLLTLPPDGIVIVVTMTPQTEPHVAPIPTNPYYPTRELPLRLRDAVAYVQWGAQVRPDEPLAQYQLRGEIDGVNAEVTIYFGTARPNPELMAAAQRQLAGFVIRPSRERAASHAAAMHTPFGARAVVDRTFACSTVLLGGTFEVEARAHPGTRAAARWAKLPFAVVASGGATGGYGGLPNAPLNSLVWITSGTPSPTTRVGSASYETFSVTAGGTVGFNRSACDPSRADVPLSATGLTGGAAPRAGVEFDCAAPRRVLVRFRATFAANPRLGERARVFLATNATASRAQLAVRTSVGRPLAYADVSESGVARLFTEEGCVRE